MYCNLDTSVRTPRGCQGASMNLLFLMGKIMKK